MRSQCKHGHAKQERHLSLHASRGVNITGNSGWTTCTTHISSTDRPPNVQGQAHTAYLAELDGCMPHSVENKGFAGQYIAVQIDWPQD